MDKNLNIVFMGTPKFSVPVLENLYNNYNVIAVYTKMPKEVGRHKILTKSDVHQRAEELRIQVITPKNFKNMDDVTTLKNLNPDMIVVAAYGIILPQSVLDVPRLGCINIHASLLPLLRGANPIQRAILNGHKKTGITIMKMDAGMDTGDMLIKDEIEINDDITYGNLSNKLSKIGSDLIIKYIDNRDNITPEKQPDNFTIAPKLSKDEEKINWHETATNIHNKIRALNPSSYAICRHKQTELKVINSSIDKNKFNMTDNIDMVNKAAGTVISANKTGIYILCGDKNIIQIKTVQKIGGKIMEVRDFLNGYKINAGDIFE